MAWVRFPDGSRRKVERVEKADAQRDLDELLALQHGLRHRTIKTNPAADVLLPEKRPSKPRKSLSVEQMQHLVVEAIPADPRPAMWLTGLMCGLRPGELAGLRWCFVDIDSDSP